MLRPYNKTMVSDPTYGTIIYILQVHRVFCKEKFDIGADVLTKKRKRKIIKDTSNHIDGDLMIISRWIQVQA